jgi:hypothetical protein
VEHARPLLEDQIKILKAREFYLAYRLRITGNPPLEKKHRKAKAQTTVHQLQRYNARALANQIACYIYIAL